MDKQGVNRQFIKAVESLLASEMVKNKRELAEKIGMTQSKLSEILNERMNVGVDALSVLVTDYKVSADWLLTGNGAMMRAESPIPPPVKTEETPAGGDDRVIRILLEELRRANEDNGILKERLRLSEKQ